jgi:hypothetical protein
MSTFEELLVHIFFIIWIGDNIIVFQFNYKITILQYLKYIIQNVCIVKEIKIIKCLLLLI